MRTFNFEEKIILNDLSLLNCVYLFLKEDLLKSFSHYHLKLLKFHNCSYSYDRAKSTLQLLRLIKVNKDYRFQGKLYSNHCSEFEQPRNKVFTSTTIINVQTYKWHEGFMTLVTNRAAAALQFLKSRMLKWPHWNKH